MKNVNKLSDPIEIKILLLRARKSQADIARKLKISRAFVCQIIKGQRHTKRVRMAIAKAVGKRTEDLWPSEPYKKAA